MRRTPEFRGPIKDAPEPAPLSDRFATLLRAGRPIAAATSSQALEAAVRDAALALLRPEHCHVFPVAAPGDATLTPQSGAGVESVSRTLLRSAIECGAPIVSPKHPAVRSSLAAPIFVHGEPFSCLYVTHRQVGESFAEDERELAALITTLAGAGYERLAGSKARFRWLAQSSNDATTLVDQLRVVEERERIARDLHDVVIQRLFALGLGLDALSARLDGAAAEQVVQATDELNHTIRDIRVAIFSLRSDEPSRPMHERLAKVFARAEQSLGFAPEVHLEGSLDALPETVHRHLLATLNEALANAARHSNAARVVVSIRAADDELVAVVMDDGVGLDPERQESGLANLRRRADLVGGSMTTGPGVDGRGLALTWRVPLPGLAAS